MGRDDVVELASWRARRGGDVNGPTTPLERVARGEHGAVEACIDAYGGMVRGLVTRLLPAHADVDDVVQEVFVAIWESADRFDPGRATDRGFVAMIARRRVIDRRRRMDRRPDTRPLEKGRTRSTDHHLRTEARVDAGPAVRALDAIGEEHRRWILMSVVEGYTHAEIAETTGRPLGTIKSAIRRGLARMRDLLENPGDLRETGR